MVSALIEQDFPNDIFPGSTAQSKTRQIQLNVLSKKL